MSAPRWKCPSCGGTDVQISLPTWYTETLDGDLTMVETDSDACVSWWYCETCSETGDGEPDDLLDRATQCPECGRRLAMHADSCSRRPGQKALPL
jgi:DNA-directed RNA polymerase subunit RPC12/RpoP